LLQSEPIGSDSQSMDFNEFIEFIESEFYELKSETIVPRESGGPRVSIRDPADMMVSAPPQGGGRPDLKGPGDVFSL